jgi:alpha-mannosidase
MPTKCRRSGGRTSPTRAATFGAAVLSDSKYGWDKPADNILRLTLLHTPQAGAWPRPFYQSSQDLGRPSIRVLNRRSRSDWRAGGVPCGRPG